MELRKRYYYGVKRSMSSELLGVLLLPALSSGWSDVVCSVTLLVEASVLLTSGGQSSDFSSVVLL